MGDFLLRALSGWLALTAFAATVIVPLGVNALRIEGPPRRRFMALHYVLGAAVPLLGLAHAAIPMGSAGMSRRMEFGLTLATVALLLLFLQSALGISLRREMTAGLAVRRAHFATMLALATLITAHVFINRV